MVLYPAYTKEELDRNVDAITHNRREGLRIFSAAQRERYGGRFILLNALWMVYQLIYEMHDFLSMYAIENLVINILNFLSPASTCGLWSPLAIRDELLLSQEFLKNYNGEACYDPSLDMFQVIIWNGTTVERRMEAKPKTIYIIIFSNMMVQAVIDLIHGLEPDGPGWSASLGIPIWFRTIGNLSPQMNIDHLVLNPGHTKEELDRNVMQLLKSEERGSVCCVRDVCQTYLCLGTHS
ncbi:hypothetical protein ACFE04_029539 [Oxalis oulophora]